MMDSPIKLFGKTIAKAAASAFTTSSGEADDAEAAPTTSSGGWVDLPSSSQDVKENAAESSGLGEINEGGVTFTRQDVKTGSSPDRTSSACNSAEEEKMCASPRGGGSGGAGAEESRSALLTPSASGGDAGGGDDEGSEEEDGSGMNGRSKKDGGDESSKGGEKFPRRPENAVACPRCHSFETKFCYYNNYNVNQPRHFCKHCQRYWTAGGTLRNVPVGAGRRKNKHGSTIAPRGQTPEVGTVRSDAPDIASPLIATKGVVPVPVQVSVVQASGSKGGIVRMAVPASSDPSVLPFLRMQPSQMDTATIFMASSDAGTSSDTATVACKRGRLATPGYSDASTGANDMDQQQQQQQSWGQQSSTNDESACSPLTSSNGNVVVHEIKGEPGSACQMMGVAAPAASGVGGPEQQQQQQQQQHPATNNSMAGPGGCWSAAGPQSSVPPPGAAGAPYGFYNGGWPYGYNVGWSAPPAFCAGGVATAGTGMPGPPPPGNIAAWNGAGGSVWTGVPWPMPSLAWGPPWAMAPWAMSAGHGGASMGSITQTISISSGAAAGMVTVPVPCSTTASGGGPASVAPPSSPSSSLGKHSRGGPPVGAPASSATAAAGNGAGGGGRGRMEGGLWAPKSLRMADPEEAMRSSVWRILGVGSRADMTTASTFKAFQPRNESKKISDDDQQAVQASLHANPAAMSRSMNFHESN
ncbi:hypothetical protein Mapa_011135 [Marchantia paleacea]|nr:hypothetical protein Mapa_011135 [Marchantia paleacea]